MQEYVLVNMECNKVFKADNDVAAIAHATYLVLGTDDFQVEGPETWLTREEVGVVASFTLQHGSKEPGNLKITF